MNRIFRTSLLLATLAAAMIFTSCKPEPTPSKPTYTVTFDAQGGKPTPAPATVTEGDKVTKPSNPVKTGYALGGWFKEADYQNEWNFATDVVTSNITLYAKWDNPNPPVNYSQYEPNTPTTINLTGGFQYSINDDGSCSIIFYDNAKINAASLIIYPSDVTNIVGTYPINFSGEVGSAAASPGSPQTGQVKASFVAGYSDGSGLVSPVYFLISGNVTLSETGLTISAKSYYGSTISITASFAPYLYESKIKTTQNLTTGSGVYAAKTLSDGTPYYVLQISDATPTFISYSILFPSGTVIDGSYDFATTLAAGTALASIGADETGDWPSYVMTTKGIWYLVSGNVNISGQNVTIHATSYNGSTINVTCSTLTQSTTFAPSMMKSNSFPTLAGKFGLQQPLNTVIK